jgi:myo-inositol-1(or 4)-monophosphatase
VLYCHQSRRYAVSETEHGGDVPTAETRADIITALTADVETAGRMALEAQRTMTFSDRMFKADESVVTEADREVEGFLVESITALDPAANIITEETRRPFDPTRSPTFAVDPIDGTDVFSQGMPGWCVAVGLLDDDLVPVAGVIFAPRLELLIVCDGTSGVALNGTPLPRPAPADPITVRSNLMITSRLHTRLDLSGYNGKIRGIGSAALHLCYPLIYPPVIGALEGPGVHIWDIAAAHAINRAQGEDLGYLNGDPIDYGPMVDGGPGADVIMAGSDPIVRRLREVLRRLPADSKTGA